MSEVPEAATALVACAKCSADIIERICRLFRQMAVHTEMVDVTNSFGKLLFCWKVKRTKHSASFYLEPAENLPAEVVDRVQALAGQA